MIRYATKIEFPSAKPPWWLAKSGVVWACWHETQTDGDLSFCSWTVKGEIWEVGGWSFSGCQRLRKKFFIVLFCVVYIPVTLTKARILFKYSNVRMILKSYIPSSQKKWIKLISKLYYFSWVNSTAEYRKYVIWENLLITEYTYDILHVLDILRRNEGKIL